MSDEITFLDELRTFVLRPYASTYAFRIDEDDVPRHVFWGAGIGPDDVAELGAANKDWWDGFNDPNEGQDELAFDGGTRFWTPALQVRFADGTRALEWRYVGHEIDGNHLRVDFTDRNYPLKVSLHYQMFDDFFERWTELEGDAEVVRVDSATWSLPPMDDYRISHVSGRWAGEMQLERVPLAHGETVFSSRRGITSHHANPWVMIDDGTATETHGEVFAFALAWSGSWRITTTRSATGRVTVSGGFGQDGVVHRLKPGEPLVTPKFTGYYARHGFRSAAKAWHHYVRSRVLPHPRELRPVLYNSWEATGFDVSEAGQRALAEQAAKLGVELFVMDDGWFGARTSDRAGLGDWKVNRDRFPDGLKPLVDAVHELGMKFGLWVEPEMVNPDSDLYREHPDWVLHHPNRKRSELRHQLVLNFARPDVVDWAYRRIDALVRTNRIDFLKWDMNRPFTEAGWPGEPDQDRLWVEHTRGVYAVIDKLRATFQWLRIEGCSGGGGRVDLGMLKRVDQFWPSDNTDALDRLRIHYGFTQVYPARAMAAWVTDNPNFVTHRSIPLRFRFHVAMTGVLGIGGNILEWSDEDLEFAREQVAIYREIRPLVQNEQLYWLRPPSGNNTVVVQYSKFGEYAIFAFRPPAARRTPVRPVRLENIDSHGRYRDLDTGEVHRGGLLGTRGLPLNLPDEEYASTLIRLLRE